MTGWVLGGGAIEVVLVSGVVWVATVMLLAGEVEVIWVAEEMDLVAGLDILDGAKQNEGKTTRDISGGTLHLKSIRAGMT